MTDEGRPRQRHPLTGSIRQLSPHPALRAAFPLGGRLSLHYQKRSIPMQRYEITGMSCAACSARVEKAVKKVPGVTSCSVSF